MSLDGQNSALANRFKDYNRRSLPSLRFNDGDVLIKLGLDPSEWLLVHASVLQASLPYCNGMLREYSDGRKWIEPDHITHTITNAPFEVRTLAIKSVDETLVLSGDKNVALPDAKDLFRNITSSVLSEGWDNRSCWKWQDGSYLPTVALAHKFLFAIIYGYPVQLKAFIDWEQSDIYIVKLEKVIEAVDIVKEACGYAEYYGAFETIATTISDILATDTWFWKAVTSRPSRFLTLAEKLRNKKMYFDVLRHTIAQAPSDYYHKAIELFSMTYKEANQWIEPLHKENDARARTMEVSLLRLQLSESWATWGGESYTPLTTYDNMLKFKHPNRSEGFKALERAALLARSIYGQWVTAQLYGSEVYEKTKINSSPAGSLAWAMQMLKRAKTWHRPPDVFGQGIVDRYVEDFQPGARFNVKKQIEAELSRIVNKVVDRIDKVFPVQEGWRHDAPCMWRGTEFVEKDSKLTYFPLDETDVPWKDEGEFTETLTIPIVDLTPASEDVLSAVGITQVAETETEAKEEEEAAAAMRTTIGN